MHDCHAVVTGLGPVGRPARPRPRSRAFLAGLLLLLAALPAAAAPVGPLDSSPDREAQPDDMVWVTMGEPLFELAARQLAPQPGLLGGLFVQRFDEHDGVILTSVPRSAIDTLSDIVHQQFGHCGGFIQHRDRAHADQAMARLRTPRVDLGTLPFTLDQQSLVPGLASQVSEAQILATITSLATNTPNRHRNSPHGQTAANWIKTQWEGFAAGRPDVTVTLYDHGGVTPQDSVVLTIPGSLFPDEIVVLGAHEDSTAGGCGGNPNCTAPGADDDASGVAVLSEVIRVTLANGFEPLRTVQFMAYAGEEGGLLGSDDIAADYQAQGRNVVAVFQMDMTGYKGSASDIYLINDWTDSDLNAFVVSLLQTYQPSLVRGTTQCGYACSDHAPWDERGFRATFPFEASFSGSNPNIHTSQDTVANLIPGGAQHAVKFGRLALAFALETGLENRELAVTVSGAGEVVSSPAGIDCPGSCSAAFLQGIEVTLAAVPDTGMMLNSWTGACTGRGVCVVDLLQDAAVSASFVLDTMPFTDDFETGNTARWSVAVP